MFGNKIVSVKDQIADQLRSDIISGSLEPNERLSEQALSERFGVSRGPIREVLLQLTKEGLLVSKSNCGVSVNSVLNSKMQELMVDIRRKIEIHALSSIKNTLTEEDFEYLDGTLERIQEAFSKEDFTEVTKADMDFHRFLIFKAGGQELVNLWYPIVLRMRMNYKRLSSPKDCVEEHKAITDALREKSLAKAKKCLLANIK
ncbi:GntR family transcriptional regulator [Gilvimarinus agarilyticus]|uniref:GntR family transcriptional regulator n=1 Tax=Gilvimarinus sp. 2_MG-2023 TaxID=3062666 RepID=UPI001C0884B4|nr:GntR family transcriptional regulator [Gilvimarinus sp. 2_MG-2023]MBU2887681.1 GntR family transcriptional regulator [Gilvimarinus agarilyticus]MDO6572329.1 GntR family transcriptional regulator [Gilvimarinus sp. 2_MG-2023]